MAPDWWSSRRVGLAGEHSYASAHHQFGFCQNSALTMKLGRPKYMHDPCIQVDNSVIRVDHLFVNISLRLDADIC